MTTDTVLCLRTTRADGRPYNPNARATGFVWPTGPEAIGQTVKAPDWNPEPVCGGGLHGLLWGEGGAPHLSDADDALWQVVEVASADVVNLYDKVKFPRCVIRYQGTRAGASEYLWARCPAGTRIAKATLTGRYRAILTGGDGATLTGGDGATLTGGDGATLTGGNYATLTGGNYATLTGRYRATLTGRYRAILTGGNYATLTGGDDAILTGGNYATLTGGDGATLTGRYRATLTGGNYAILTGGNYATLTGGDGAILSWRLWDGRRYRIHTVYTGEDGIEAGVAYRAVWRDGAPVVERVDATEDR